VEKFDRVDREDGVDGTGRCLQVRENILAEEVDDIDQDIRGGDTELGRWSDLYILAGYFGQTCCVDPLEAIDVRR